MICYKLTNREGYTQRGKAPPLSALVLDVIRDAPAPINRAAILKALADRGILVLATDSTDALSRISSAMPCLVKKGLIVRTRQGFYCKAPDDQDRQYFVGVDVSGGVDSSDSTISVFDAVSSEKVFEWRARSYQPHELAAAAAAAAAALADSARSAVVAAEFRARSLRAFERARRILAGELPAEKYDQEQS